MRFKYTGLVVLIAFAVVYGVFFHTNDASLEHSFAEKSKTQSGEQEFNAAEATIKSAADIVPDAHLGETAQTEQVIEHPISIVGDATYVKYVNQCLDLLATKSPEDYQFVLRYIGEVVQAPRSGMDVRSIPPSFKMSDRSAYYSLTWCSAILVHDAFHSYRYQERVQRGKDYLRSSEQVFAEERDANARQIKAMSRIGAPQHEIDHMKKQDGRHGDVNKDGKYDWEDQKLRDW